MFSRCWTNPKPKDWYCKSQRAITWPFGKLSWFNFNKLICHQILFWLVVSTPPKNISQWEGFSQILWKIKECSKPPTSFCGSQSKCFWLLPGLKSQTCPGPGAASWAGAWSIHTSPVKPSHNLGGYKTMIKHFFVGFYKLISFRYFYPLVI